MKSDIEVEITADVDFENNEASIIRKAVASDKTEDVSYLIPKNHTEMTYREVNHLATILGSAIEWGVFSGDGKASEAMKLWNKLDRLSVNMEREQ